MAARKEYKLRTTTPRMAAAGTGSSSTLRERLSARSAVPKQLPRRQREQSSKKKPASLYRQLQEEFRAAVGGESHSQRRTSATPRNSTLDEASRLAECLAVSGTEIHAATLTEISDAFEAVKGKINKLAAASSKALDQTNDLYDNISYPLSATLCRSDKKPRATIAEHFASLQDGLTIASDKLRDLHASWQQCLQSEQELWHELGNPPNEEGEPRIDFGELESEIKAVSRAATKDLDALDAKHREYFQAETMKIMQQIMAD